MLDQNIRRNDKPTDQLNRLTPQIKITFRKPLVLKRLKHQSLYKLRSALIPRILLAKLRPPFLLKKFLEQILERNKTKMGQIYRISSQIKTQNQHRFFITEEKNGSLRKVQPNLILYFLILL